MRERSQFLYFDVIFQCKITCRRKIENAFGVSGVEEEGIFEYFSTNASSNALALMESAKVKINLFLASNTELITIIFYSGKTTCHQLQWMHREAKPKVWM